MRYPPPRWIFVDTDGTLARSGVLDEYIVDFLKQKRIDGFKIVLWSSRGQKHAQDVAEKYEVIDLFDFILSKPGYLIDDKGWRWIRYTKVIREA